ncbi:hypothetical protein [Stenotrophomonas sp. 278]|uniref:hypothetical protein n=1 Tax=Stenotrophomonas sp. 278 TaxID=2479851 RepID=UPI000F6644EB|nr:hypothetical protein [Stenotrophomonas sp. 278]RRU14860.1 hypothetical protein EGJ34_10330 [Stenotrophomonas sp. 278]
MRGTASKGRATKAARAALLRPAERGQPKLRFAPRGLRYLQRWSEGFAGRFPSAEEIAEHPRYWNNKIPVESRLVEAPFAAVTRNHAARRSEQEG